MWERSDVDEVLWENECWKKEKIPSQFCNRRGNNRRYVIAQNTRKRKHHINNAHQNLVKPAAKISGKRPYHNASHSSDLAGVGRLRIIFVHILPNTFTVLMSSIMIGFNNAVLAEAGMSYLGKKYPCQSYRSPSDAGERAPQA